MEYIPDTREFMPSEEREHALNERLRLYVRRIYVNVPAIKEILDGAGISPSQIRTTSDLVKVPITRKEEFLKRQRAEPPFGGFFELPIGRLKRIFMSPGPMYVSSEVYVPTFVKILGRGGIGPGDRVSVTFGYHLGPMGIVIDRAAEELGATVINAGVGNTALQVQLMRELKVNVFLGTPSFLMTLIRTAEQQGYNLRRDFELRRAYLSAEPLPRSLRKAFEEDYGIDTFQSYGMNEVGMTHYECSAKLGMHFDEDTITELVDPETGKHVQSGEPGELVMTPLKGPFPLLRYGSGDISAYTEEPCPCGRTSKRVLWVMGRVGDVVKVRGEFVAARQVDEVVAQFSEIARAQVVVDRVGHRDEMTIRVELKEEIADKANLLDNLHKGIQDICRVRADKIEFVAKGTIPQEYKKVVDRRTWE